MLSALKKPRCTKLVVAGPAIAAVSFGQHPPEARRVMSSIGLKVLTAGFSSCSFANGHLTKTKLHNAHDCCKKYETDHHEKAGDAICVDDHHRHHQIMLLSTSLSGPLYKQILLLHRRWKHTVVRGRLFLCLVAVSRFCCPAAAASPRPLCAVLCCELFLWEPPWWLQ